jgi:hypothetical protein
MTEWSNVLTLKVSVLPSTIGSNPILSGPSWYLEGYIQSVVAEGTLLGNHTFAVQKGLNLGVALFIVSEVFFFISIF